VSQSPESARSRAEIDGRSVWLHHAVLTDEDVDWLAPLPFVTFWNVKAPGGFFSRLPNLIYLDVRGGSSTDASFVRGCAKLRFLTINQVRGLADLSEVAKLRGLELLNLYGLPQVIEPPSLAGLKNLKYLELGSLKGLTGLGGLLDAPSLTDLRMIRKVGVTIADAQLIASHPSIERFDWSAEDVPDKLWMPFVKIVGKPEGLFPRDWINLQLETTGL
jgi:hypothetical protein